MSQSRAQQKLIIIDGNALLHRAWHALPQTMKIENGTLTNAAYGFTTILLKALQDIHPSHIVVCFDAPGKTFRDKMYKEYKATRKKQPQELYDQIPIIQEILDSLNIPYYQKKGVEADDVIATLVEHAKKQKGLKTVVVSGDMDLLQLVGENVEVYTPKRGITEMGVYDTEAVKERYDGLMPEQLADFKGLRGDPSDNIPGATGIGEKTALDILKITKNIEKIYDALKKHTPEELGKKTKIKERVWEKLKDSEKNVILSKKLVILKDDVRLKVKFDDFLFHDFNPAKVMDVLQKYKFRSVSNTIPKLAEKFDIEMQEAAPIQENKGYVFVETKEAVKQLVHDLKKQKVIAVDTETTSLDIVTAEIVGLSFSFKKDKGYYVESKYLKDFKSILEDEKIKKIGHNIKYDWQVLRNAGIRMQGIYFDTMIAAYILNPGGRVYSLDGLAFEHFRKTMQKIEDLIGPKGKQGQLNMGQVDPKKVAYYAAEDADITWQLYEKFNKEIKKRKQEQVFFDIDMPIVEILGEMEQEGILLDSEFLKKLGNTVAKQLQKVEQKICSLAGRQFNIASPKQLKEILFDKLEIDTKGLRRTKTGISTAASELEKLRGRHPIVEHIFGFRELSKLQSTYIKALPMLVHPKTKRIHTSFNQVVAATGRLSSTEPNMQNIPVRTELGRKIRKAFIAEKGYELVALDYSQIELRVVAHMSEDKEMVKTFKQDHDIHTETAAKIFNKKPSEVTEDERRHAKEANFGVLYGLGARGLAERTGVPYEEAADFIERYKALYPEVFAFLQSAVTQAQKEGFVETLYGRRRYLPEINSGAPMVRAAAERAALNMPTQGTAADIMKKGMIRVESRIKNLESREEIRLLLQVHDELVFEVKKGKASKWVKIIKKEMEEAAKLIVPLKVDAKVGKNWKEMEAI